MSKKRLFLASMIGILFVVTMFSSCATTYTASGTKVSEIDEFALIEPKSIIIYYDKPTSGYRDPSLASASEQLLTDILTNSRYPFTDPIPADYEGKRNLRKSLVSSSKSLLVLLLRKQHRDR